MSQIKKAALLSYINLTITNVVGLFITPFVIRMLGDSEYGLYTLIGAFVGYLSILDLGLNNAIIRFVAQYRAQKDSKGQENFLATSLIIYGLISIVIGTLGVLMYVNMNSLFGDTLTPVELGKAKIMMLILVFNIAITIPGGAFTGICNGYEEFIFPRMINLVKYILRTIMVITILYLGADALGLVILDTVMNVFYIGASAYFVFGKLKIKIKLHHWELSFIREIFGYSLWIFVFGLVYQFQWRTGQIILGTTTDTTTVAIYGVGVMLGLYFLTFGNVFNGFFLPRAVKSIYKNSSRVKLTQEMVKVSRLTLPLLFFILGGFLVIGQDFIYLWVGNTYQESWLVALLIMVAYVLPVSQGYAHAILEAKKLIRFKASYSLILSIIGITIGGYLSKDYGIYGMIFGIFGALMLLHLIVMFYYHKRADVDMFFYFRKAFLPYLFIFCVVSFLTSYFFAFFDSPSWFNFILKGVIYTVVFILFGIIILNNSERKYMKSVIKRLKFNL